MAKSPRPFLALGTSVLLWGSAFAGIRVGLRGYAPGELALLRFGVASVVLAAASRGGLKRPRPADVPGFLLLGLFGIALYNLAIGYAQQRIPASTASFLVASAPIWMGLVAAVVFKERLSAIGWAGIAIAFGGIGLITAGSGHGIRLEPRALVALAAALAQGLFFLGQKPFLKRYSALHVTTFALWGGTLLLLPYLGGLLASMARTPVSVSLAVVYLGIFPGAIGYVTWAHGLSFVPAPTAGSFLYLVPPVAMAVAWVWLGEVPTAVSIAGGVLVVAGVVLVTRRGRVAAIAPARDPADSPR